MSQLYTLVINGKPEGPFTIDELKQQRIKPGDFVRTDGMDDYKEAHELPELREILGFRQQLPEPQYFGSFDQRLMASALDWFFISAICSVLGAIAMLFTPERMGRLVIFAALTLLIPLVKVIYNIIMECSPKQATYGKQFLKIRVTDMYGAKINAGQSIGRNLAKVFSVMTLFIGYLMSFFNKKQQCLHDMIAGTLVVKDRL